MIAIVVHLELPLMFGFKILIKLKSEITGLKNKYCCVPPFIHFLVDRGRNVNVYRNEQHISFKLQTQSLKIEIVFLTMNATHPSPEISFLSFPTMDIF